MNGAIKNIDTVMGGTMIDYVIANISETRIMDVYEHNAPKKQERDDKPEYKVKLSCACCFSNKVQRIEHYHNSSRPSCPKEWS